MKKTYTKPEVFFETMEMDMPIAASCDKNYIADCAALKDMGYFGGGCTIVIANDEEENSILGPLFGDDKLCYYSSVSNAFTS